MAIPSYQNFGILENLAADRAREFLRPKTPTEQLQLIFVVLWFLLAFLDSTNTAQFFVFLLVLMLIIFNSFSSYILKLKGSRSLSAAILRLGIFFWIYTYFNPFIVISATIGEWELTKDVIQTQKLLLAGLFIIGLITRKLQLELLITRKFEDYQDFIGGMSLGYAHVAIVCVLLYNWSYIPRYIFDQPPRIFLNFSSLEILLLTGVLAYFIANLAPLGSTKRRQLRAQSLLLVTTTRFERIRFAILSAGVILIILSFFGLLSSLPNKNTINSFSVVLFALGVILFIFGTGSKRTTATKEFWGAIKQGLSPTTTSFEELLPKSVIEAKQRIKDQVINLEKDYFFKIEEDATVIKTGESKNSFIIKKNSIAVPVTETDNEVTVVFIGNGQLENDQEEKKETKAMTMILPRAGWEDIAPKLALLKPNTDLIQSLATIGINSKEQFISFANQALDNFKNWLGPKELITQAKIQAFLEDAQSGKYGVIKEGEYSRVRLPGIIVIESPEVKFVNILGMIKVLEAPSINLSSVDMPFIKVFEARDYEFVRGPGFRVFSSPEGELVNILGFNVAEGNKQLLSEKIQQVMKDQVALYQLMGGPLEKILEDPQKTLIVTQSLQGEKKLLLASKNDAIIEDVVSTSIIPLNHANKRETDREEREARRHNRGRRHKGVSINVEYDFKTKSKNSSSKEREKMEPNKTILLKEVSKEEQNHIKPSITIKTDEESYDKQIITNISNGVITEPKKIIIKEKDEIVYPECLMCNKVITTGAILCPHCKHLFHKNHYLSWVRDTGQCYFCKNPIKLEFE